MSIEISPRDAFGLTLIAQDPERNADTVENLVGEHAKIIGRALIGADISEESKEIKEAVEIFRDWGVWYRS